MTKAYIRDLVKRHCPSKEYFVETVKKGKTYTVKFYRNGDYYALVNSVSFISACHNLGLDIFRDDDLKKITINEI